MSAEAPEVYVSYVASPANGLIVTALKRSLDVLFPFAKLIWDEDGPLSGPTAESKMAKLAQGDYVIFILSAEFCTSQWRMYELALSAQFELFQDRVFLLTLPDFKLESEKEVEDILQNWKGKRAEIKHDLDEIDPVNAPKIVQIIQEELRIVDEIVNRSGKALSQLVSNTRLHADQNGDLDRAILDAFWKKVIEFPPSIQHLLQDMVFIAGGTFKMGTQEYDDEKPIHDVSLSDFQIGKYPVTQAQWAAIMGNNPSYFKNCSHCPVEKVSWENCQTFIHKLNSITGLKFRLPTEAEWEYAAIGGSKSKGYTYAGSNDLDIVAWFWDNSKEKTHSVGMKLPNELGLHDMSGNVWEWCQDWYGEEYYVQHSRNPVKDPQGPEEGESRVLRGGSWGNDKGTSRLHFRSEYAPEENDMYSGLRLTLSIS